MTLPRRIIPGMTVMVTRRTHARTHLLRPDPALDQLFVYCLAVAAERHRIAVHAAVLMSTHHHIVLTDVAGRLPRFLHEFHRLLALGVKALRGWRGSVWDSAKSSVVELRTPRAFLEKVAYVMANPVTAGLVRRASQWRGTVTAPSELGRGSRTATRPRLYFSRRNLRWAGSATVHWTLPPYVDLSEDEVRDAVGRELARIEATVRVRSTRGRSARRSDRGSPRASHLRRATSPEASGTLNPVFAVGQGQPEALRAAISEMKSFWHAHQVAMERWRAGDRDVQFPCGTWLMYDLHGVTRAAA